MPVNFAVAVHWFFKRRSSEVAMYILGISSYSHESSCALIADGAIKCVVEEERFNRRKHTVDFPFHAIQECLRREGIGWQDIDYVTFFWLPFREVVENMAHFMVYFPATMNLFKKKPGDELPFFPRLWAMQQVGRDIQKHFKLPRPPRIQFIEHHLCHAASAFFVSPFEEAAILTIDGRGEAVSTMMSVGRKGKIRKLKEIKVPHSLGHLYAAITDYLGFRPFFDEWKVMGMSAYGKEVYEDVFSDILHLEEKGDYRLNLKYFRFHTHGQNCWMSDYFIQKLGPRRESHAPYEQKHYDIAYGLQKMVEKAGVHLAKDLFARTRLPYLCMAGGVTLNCLMNKRIVEESGFEQFFFQPIANDAGTSLGSALYQYHQVCCKPRHTVFSSVYLGPEYSNDQIEACLKKKGVVYKKSENIAFETARHIARGKIVGWFQGRMEAGPRALGHRSIVVDPTDQTMKDRLNARVKKREHFRPFAPSVLEEKVGEYFVMPKGQLSPYMILIGDVREDKRKIIPAVTHADGTARVHTVNKEIAPKYWQLIHEFESIKGVPVLLNTSFNENEPIVCTPEDAVNCFLRTEFDVLAIGDFLVVKNQEQAAV